MIHIRFLTVILPKKNTYLKNQVASRCQTTKISKTQTLPYEQGIYQIHIIFKQILNNYVYKLEWALTRFLQ
jgi:hypothetical protein